MARHEEWKRHYFERKQMQQLSSSSTMSASASPTNGTAYSSKAASPSPSNSGSTHHFPDFGSTSSLRPPQSQSPAPPPLAAPSPLHHEPRRRTLEGTLSQGPSSQGSSSSPAPVRSHQRPLARGNLKGLAQSTDSPVARIRDGCAEVDLSNSGLSGITVQPVLLALRSNASVRSLVLDSIPLVESATDLLCDVVKQHPALSVLSLKGCKLTEQAGRHLLLALQHNPRLAELRLQGNNLITARTRDAIAVQISLNLVARNANPAAATPAERAAGGGMQSPPLRAK